MDLELGHGFIPRIGEGNYKAIDRCVGPADLFNVESLDLPWAVIDGAWAEGRPELLATLKNNGTKPTRLVNKSPAEAGGSGLPRTIIK